MTPTFNVTVDDPFPTGQTEILNTATTAATEVPIPQSASALNIVVVPTSGSATVGDRVWLDADGDGVLDPGEAGLPGVEVTLKDQWGTPLRVTTTDSQGRYIFIDVEPGNGYFVEVSGACRPGSRRPPTRVPTCARTPSTSPTARTTSTPTSASGRARPPPPSATRSGSTSTRTCSATRARWASAA